MDDKEGKLSEPNVDISGVSKLSEKIPSSGKVNNLDLEMQKLKIVEKKDERGWIGHIWGASEHSSNNIAGLLIVSILVIGAAYTAYMICVDACCTHQEVLDFWKLLTPLLTMALGYIFGHKV